MEKQPTSPTSQEYSQRVVEAIQTTNPLASACVLQAFGSIPRHLFVDHYYLYEGEESKQWTRYDQEESPAWYERVYSGEALITHVEEHGRLLSSSSEPGIMATMLDALEVKPGMRVLEIGTGTGYNAALLACLVGDPHLVTTVDIDAQAIEPARHAITQVVGEGMTIKQADGRKGYSANAPYDRIIVTASAPTVPWTWKEQLAPGGILVCILEPRLAKLGGLLKAQEAGRRLQGRILETAGFMELRDSVPSKHSIQIDFRAPLHTSFPLDRALFEPDLIRKDHDFTFFLYNEIPDLHMFYKGGKGEALVFYAKSTPEGYVVCRQSQVKLRGDRSVACSLWTRLVRAYGQWLHYGRPAISQYQFEMDDISQSLAFTIPSGSMVWPFIRMRQTLT